MKLVSPQSKFLREPNLLVPGLKPIGPVQACSNHFAGKHFAFGSVLVPPYVSIEGRTIERFGDIRFTARGVKFSNTSAPKLVFDHSFPVFSEFSILLRYARGKTNLSDGLMSSKTFSSWNSTSGMSLNLGPAGEVYFKLGTASTLTPSAWPPNTMFRNLFLTYKDNVGTEMYVDLVEVAYTQRDVIGAGYTLLPTDPFKLGTYYNEVPDRNCDGYMVYAFVFNKAFTLPEATELTRHPYQFLSPA